MLEPAEIGFDVLVYKHKGKELTMKRMLLPLMMAGTLAGVSSLGAIEVGFEHWEKVWPAGRMVTAQTGYSFVGEFKPGKDYNEKKWLRWNMAVAVNDTRLLFSGSQELVTQSRFINPNVGFFYTIEYLQNEGLTIQFQADMNPWLIDPWELDSVLREKERAYENEHSILRTWLSKKLPWGKLAEERRKREEEARKQQQEDYKRITGKEPLQEAEGRSFTFETEDDFQRLRHLAEEHGTGVEELEALREGVTLVRTLSDEFTNRVIHIRTPKKRVVPNGRSNDFAEGFADIYFENDETLEAMAKRKQEDLGYSYTETEDWKRRIRQLGKIAALNTDKLDGLSEELEDRGITDPLKGYKCLTKKNGLAWAKKGEYQGSGSNRAYEYFYDTHKEMEVYLPIWGEKENRDACLPGDRAINETWNFPGTIFNGLKHRDLDNYEFTGYVTVTRLADEVPNTPLRLLEDADGTTRKCYVLKVVSHGTHKNGDTSETTLALVPKDKQNPNLYALRYQDTKKEENFIYVDPESGLPVLIEVSLEGEVIGREKEIDMERTKGLELKDGSKLVFRMRWETTDVRQEENIRPLWDCDTEE